ncbi:toxin-antitoxin system YwqK family antitoxin [Alteromonas stellipolaris]|uniref:toxin-antitoxin system YwqK family antitoxin n=1 Tax=Alteromonas stellipolaris TaxID=233316 RepID=UPI0024945B97|nr:toxin-antitoxin system YwqK family antitoxin [Alteromonas stellipolaris]
MTLTKATGYKVLLFCALWLAATSGSVSFSDRAQLVVYENAISLNKQGVRIYQNAPFTGKVVSYHSTGALATEDEFVAGRRAGGARKWFSNGTLGYEAYYVSGAREGSAKTWWVNGNLRSAFVYENGKVEGEGWRWYRSGAKFKKFNYHEGQPVGLQQAWRKNGTLYSNFEYKNGRIYGLRKANNCVGLEEEVISVDYYQNQARLRF